MTAADVDAVLACLQDEYRTLAARHEVRCVLQFENRGEVDHTFTVAMPELVAPPARSTAKRRKIRRAPKPPSPPAGSKPSTAQKPGGFEDELDF